VALDPDHVSWLEGRLGHSRFWELGDTDPPTLQVAKAAGDAASGVVRPWVLADAPVMMTRTSDPPLVVVGVPFLERSALMASLMLDDWPADVAAAATAAVLYEMAAEHLLQRGLVEVAVKAHVQACTVSGARAAIAEMTEGRELSWARQVTLDGLCPLHEIGHHEKVPGVPDVDAIAEQLVARKDGFYRDGLIAQIERFADVEARIRRADEGSVVAAERVRVEIEADWYAVTVLHLLLSEVAPSSGRRFDFGVFARDVHMGLLCVTVFGSVDLVCRLAAKAAKSNAAERKQQLVNAGVEAALVALAGDTRQFWQRALLSHLGDNVPLPMSWSPGYAEPGPPGWVTGGDLEHVERFDGVLTSLQQFVLEQHTELPLGTALASLRELVAGDDAVAAATSRFMQVARDCGEANRLPAKLVELW
jgi:hypothetical protein